MSQILRNTDITSAPGSVLRRTSIPSPTWSGIRRKAGFQRFRICPVRRIADLVLALQDPYRHQMESLLGAVEAAGVFAQRNTAMQSDPESRAIASGGGFKVPLDSASWARDRQRINSVWALMPIVAASGFAGLGDEIVGTRQLSITFGTEMVAVVGAVAGFFGGLALGAFVLDRPIRRSRSPRTVYATLEAVIGLWGLINIWLLPAAGRAISPLLGTEPAPALLWAVSFAWPTLVLLPATAAMGGTLIALERMMREACGDARVTAGVYGANTAGAVAGTLISTFLLLPALGLSGTLVCLAGVNAVCALGSLALGSTFVQAKPEADEVLPRKLRGLRLTITLFATGLLGIAFEVIVVRLAAPRMQAWDGSSPGRLSPAWRQRFSRPISLVSPRLQSTWASLENWLSRWRSSWCRRPRWERCSAFWRNGYATNAGRWDGRLVSIASGPQWHRC